MARARKPHATAPCADQDAPPPGVRPWVPPRILYREPLEAIAAVCAPSPPAKGNPGLCPVGPISS
jgi:hypothetical protein